MIELERGRNFEHALSGLESFRHIWVVFWFHLNRGWRPRVAPPRSHKKRGVFATRSPYRPCPIGLSALELVRIDGLELRVRNLDLLDGTPVLDIKPYLSYTDALPESGNGWLEAASAPDPGPHYRVEFSPLVLAQLDYLAGRGQTELGERIERVLSLGTAAHPYRRIRREGALGTLAMWDFRADFEELGPEHVRVFRLRSGYRPRAIETGTEPAHLLHRDFVRHFASRLVSETDSA